MKEMVGPGKFLFVQDKSMDLSFFPVHFFIWNGGGGFALSGWTDNVHTGLRSVKEEIDWQGGPKWEGKRYILQEMAADKAIKHDYFLWAREYWDWMKTSEGKEIDTPEACWDWLQRERWLFEFPQKLEQVYSLFGREPH